MHVILKDFKGSPDGFTVNEYKEGQEIELPPSLVSVAEEEKWAKPKESKSTSKPKESKKIDESSSQSVNNDLPSQS